MSPVFAARARQAVSVEPEPVERRVLVLPSMDRVLVKVRARLWVASVLDSILQSPDCSILRRP